MSESLSRIQALKGTINELRATVEEETAALRAHNRAAMDNIVDRKLHLAGQYEKAMRALQSDPPAAADIPPHVKGELCDAEAELNRALDENAKALEAALSSGERILQTIVRVARRIADRTKTTYCSLQNQGPAPRPDKEPVTSIAIDQQA